MTPFWGQLAGTFIVLMMVAFIGIWIWAWNARHHGAFTRMSQLPMEDDALPSGAHEDHPTRETPP